jgi:hypothetical protein
MLSNLYQPPQQFFPYAKELKSKLTPKFLFFCTVILFALISGRVAAAEQPEECSFSLLEPRSNLSPATQVKMVASPNTLVADGATSSLVTVTVTDIVGHPLTGQALNFSSTNANVLISPTTAVTNCAGQALTTFASQKQGLQTLTTAVGPVKLQRAAVNFSCNGTFIQNSQWPGSTVGPRFAVLTDINLDKKCNHSA